MSRPALDMIGRRYGKLTVVSFSHRTSQHKFWICKCDCGNEIKASTGNLQKGDTLSCTCQWAERFKAGRQRACQEGTKHGLTIYPEYYVWQAMVYRCTRPKDKAWKNYGGRGIKVCQRWMDSVKNFFDDMGLRPSQKHTLERINNDGNYEPSNCRWATWSEQALNRRPKGVNAI